MNRQFRVIIATVIIAGLAASVTARYLLMELDRQQLHELVTTRALQFGKDVNGDIGQNVEVLNGLRDFLQLSRIGGAEQFVEYAHTVSDRYPGIESLLWIPHVTIDTREAFEQEMQRVHEVASPITELTPGGILTPAGDRLEFFPVAHTIPETEHTRFVGLDLLTDPRFKTAIENTRKTDTIVITPPMTRQRQMGPRYGVFAFLPVFKEMESPHGGKARDLVGIVAAILRVGDILEEVILESQYGEEEYRVSLIDISAEPEIPIHHVAELGSLFDDSCSAEEDIFLPGARIWRLSVAPSIPYIASRASIFPGLIFIAGLVMTSLLIFYLYSVARRSGMIEDLVRKRTQELEESGSFNQTIVETAPSGILTMDVSGDLLTFNPAAEKMFGFTSQEAVGMNIARIIPRLSHAIRSGYEDGLKSLSGQSHEMEARRRDNFRFPILLGISELKVGGRPLYLGIITDLQEQVETRKQLERIATTNKTIVQMAVSGIVTIDAKGIVTSFNPAAERLLGYREEEILGENIMLLIPEPHRSNHAHYLSRYIRTGVSRILGTEREEEALHKNGTRVPISLAVSEIRLGDDISFMGMITDIREQVKARKILEDSNRTLNEMARKDGLTGIANRRHFNEILDQEWARAARASRPLSLVLCDIDFFKRFNDTYGHQQGDSCLRQVARTMAAQIRRAADLAARYGGEEFAMLLPDTDMGGAANVAENVRRAITALAIPHQNSDAAKHVTLSLGVATFVPTAERSAKQLIDTADTALYQAKKEGRNRVRTMDQITDLPPEEPQPDR